MNRLGIYLNIKLSEKVSLRRKYLSLDLNDEKETAHKMSWVKKPRKQWPQYGRGREFGELKKLMED